MKHYFSFNVREIDEEYDFEVYGVSSMLRPHNNSIMFLTPKNLNEACGIEQCENCLVFVPEDYHEKDFLKKHCILHVSNPRLAYAKLVNKLVCDEDFVKKEEYENIHGSYISQQAVIGEHVSIGPGCYIGSDVEIGDHCIIYSGVKIHGPARIGKNVIIRDNAVIGALGFGFVSENGERVRFPFLGSVEIEDDVEIGTLSNIEKGSADATILKKGVKLDVMSIVGHDTYIGENTMSIGSHLAGYVTVGRDCFLGFCSTVKPRVCIGDHATVGLGAAVVKDVRSDATVAGVPAKELKTAGYPGGVYDKRSELFSGLAA